MKGSFCQSFCFGYDCSLKRIPSLDIDIEYKYRSNDEKDNIWYDPIYSIVIETSAAYFEEKGERNSIGKPKHYWTARNYDVLSLITAHKYNLLALKQFSHFLIKIHKKLFHVTENNQTHPLSFSHPILLVSIIREMWIEWTSNNNIMGVGWLVGCLDGCLNACVCWRGRVWERAMKEDRLIIWHKIYT